MMLPVTRPARVVQRPGPAAPVKPTSAGAGVPASLCQSSSALPLACRSALAWASAGITRAG
jgi:hypothetical protein